MLCPGVQAAWLGQVFWAPSSSETHLLLPFNVNQMWGTSTQQGRGHSQRPLTTPRAPQHLGRGFAASSSWWPSPLPSLLLPSPRPTLHSSWHPLYLSSLPTGNNTGQISKVHMPWTVSLGIFWASSLLYVSCPFHSAFKNKIGKRKMRVSVLLPPSATLPSLHLGKRRKVCAHSQLQWVIICYSHYLF